MIFDTYFEERQYSTWLDDVNYRNISDAAKLPLEYLLS